MAPETPDGSEAALPPSWFITISNKSSQSQNYAVFSEVPLIDSSVKPGKVYNNVVAVADNVPNLTGTATFNFKKQLRAICGRLVLDDADSSTLFNEDSADPPDAASIVEVNDECKVALGTKLADGTNSPGTQCVIQVTNNETPTFITPPLTGGKVGAFAVQTGKDFTNKDARSMHYFLGFGSSMNQSVGPFAMFVPSPNQIYQISPQAKFYVLVADLEPRTVLTDAQKGTALKVDFDELGYDAVKIEHDTNGNLTILKPSSDLG